MAIMCLSLVNKGTPNGCKETQIHIHMSATYIISRYWTGCLNASSRNSRTCQKYVVDTPATGNMAMPGVDTLLTNDISIEFEIRSTFAVLYFKTCSTDHNEILHTSRQYRRDVCKILLWSSKYVMKKSIVKFHWISNVTEISLLGLAPGLYEGIYMYYALMAKSDRACVDCWEATAQQAHGAIITSLSRQNDDVASFWRYYSVMCPLGKHVILAAITRHPLICLSHCNSFKDLVMFDFPLSKWVLVTW